jgi:RNA polymerase sigma factor (sigma-70 family)
MPATRLSLIVRLKSPADQQAWSEFVKIYAPVILTLARRRGLQDSDAQDIVQEVLGKVATTLTRWDSTAERGSFQGWLSKITHNLVIDFLRSRRRPHVPLNNLDTAILQTPDRESKESQIFLLERERQIFLWAAERVRQRCRPKNWDAFWKTAVLQQSVEMVAHELQIPRGVIYVARSRVMALIRSEVQDFESQESGLLSPQTDGQEPEE